MLPVDKREAWLAKAQEVAKQVISAASKTINANTWEKRCKELHPTITAALDANLKNLIAKYKGFTKESTTFYSAAMLTYDDNGKSCVSHKNYSVYGTHELVTYLAQPDFGDKLRPYKTDLENHEQEILDKTFSSPSNSLCKTAANALNDVLGLSVKDKETAFVVVRCGYEFVWYELGYKYFPAANSTSPYVLTTHANSDYSSNCGQIILFP
ncbi:hypothetical protein AAVH_21534 [Aphelenchoides avenae]|nr:hypothetical protein AAVH_21534 [Aphelenchus avenae]